MDTAALKKILQDHFKDGLVTIVGSGLSCAEGLPSMAALADYLIRVMPSRLDSADRSTWDEVSGLIPKVGLEVALFSIDVPDSIQELIAAATVELVAAAEEAVLTEVFCQGRILRMSTLVPHILKPASGIPVITTNYDTLLEVAFEEAGLGVDTMFVGQFAGALNEREAKASLLRDAKLVRGKGVRYRFRDHVVISKPHGSLDWYYRDGRPVRCGIGLRSGQRLIIAPGKLKYRSGYESPFDRQRERANEAIDRATRFLVIGYGFNDDHLETHLTPAIRHGKPALLITRNLSENAEKIAIDNLNVIAIDRRDIDDRSRVIYQGVSNTIDQNLWDLSAFVTGVFGA